MTTVLFTYRRKFTVNGVDKYNINYINPLNVVSFFWEENEDGNSMLNVFLNAVRTDPRSGATNSYAIRFGKDLGERFVQHMEDFLRYLAAAPQSRVVMPDNNNPNNRRHRRAIEAKVIEEDTTAVADTAWVNN